MRAGRAQRGFTLIEMMVVVAIIGILSLLFVSLSARTYGANADTVADEIAAQMGFAKLRAVQTRRFHCVEIKNVVASPKYQMVVIYQATTIGMGTPTNACPNPANWSRVQSLNIPVGSSVFDVSSSVCPTAGSCTAPTANASLDATLLFKPDGTVSSGATVWISDSTGARKDRVLVYSATGDAYGRKLW